MADENGKFNPTAHLTDIGGKDYLEVKWRIAWFRDQHTDGIIETEMTHHDDSQAIFHAKVSIPSGGAASGWGSETASDYGDFIEKAETKAIGRALAALGFGTQFCEDFDEGGAVTDAPVVRTSAAPRQRVGARATSGKLMPLKYAGECTDCGYRIASGTTAIYDAATKTVRHAEGDCPSGGGYQNTGEQTS